jgi:hypothetical protein
VKVYRVLWSTSANKEQASIKIVLTARAILLQKPSTTKTLNVAPNLDLNRRRTDRGLIGVMDLPLLE